MKWIGTQTLYDSIRLAGNSKTIQIGGAGTGTLNLTGNKIKLYDATNDGNPTISLGSADAERLEIKTEYESGAQGLDVVKFTTYTAGTSANDGRFAFYLDETFLFNILDNGIRIKVGGELEIGSGNTILSDSSGTTTLSNIDD